MRRLLRNFSTTWMPKCQQRTIAPTWIFFCAPASRLMQGQHTPIFARGSYRELTHSFSSTQSKESCHEKRPDHEEAGQRAGGNQIQRHGAQGYRFQSSRGPAPAAGVGLRQRIQRGSRLRSQGHRRAARHR